MTNRMIMAGMGRTALRGIASDNDLAPVWSVDFTQQSAAGAGLSFTRASNAGYYDRTGAWVTALTDTMRCAYDPATLLPKGFLSEEARTNYLLNSATPATQTVSLAVGTYTLWVEGTGSCVCAAGTAVGSGFGTANASASVTFTLTTAGTVVFTKTGTLTRFQCENGANATSFIATTTAAATRSGDVCSLLNAPLNAAEGTLLLTGTVSYATGATSAAASFDDGSGGNATRMHAYMRTSPTGIFTQIANATIADLRKYDTLVNGSLVKMAMKYGPTGSALVVNGVLVASNSTSSSGLACTALRIGHKAFGGVNGQPNAHIAKVSYFNRALATVFLQQMTS